ncbi:MAG TPA: M1 family metallopeptidase [Pyrinomonadaceae bacterium]|jgi:aminopeptidase N
MLKNLFGCVFVSAVLFVSIFAQGNTARPTGSGGVLMPEQAAYDVKAYDLALSVDVAAQSIKGVLTAKAKIVQPIDKFVLDLDTPYTVESVSLVNGKKQRALTFKRTDKQIWIDFPKKMKAGKTVEVRVTYSGVPRVAPYPPWVGGFVWKKTADGQPWFSTAVQNDGADLWFPVKDHPSDEAETVSLHFTVPANLTAASNGTLKSVVKNADGTQTFNWFVANPINNYDIALNVAPYKLIEDKVQSVGGEMIPIQFYILPEHFEKGQALINQEKEFLKFYEQYLGPYPFRNEKIGIIETPFIAMEHQTATAYGGKFEYGKLGYDWTQFHEFGHEWWGNMVTASDWRDFWLHEGFQTFMDDFYRISKEGRNGFINALPRRIKSLNNIRAVAPREPQITTEMFFLPPAYTKGDNDIYTKGGLTLNTLRFYLGDEAFLRSLRRMAYPTPAMEKITNGKQTRLVTTDDFLRIAERESGKKLDWFFEVYLRQPVLPKLSTETNGNQLTLRWETPNNLPFPLPVEVKTSAGTTRVEMPNGTAKITLPLDGQYTIDPNGWLLKAL